MPDPTIQSLQNTLDGLTYVVSALGGLQLLRGIGAYLLRDYFDRGRKDVEALRAEVDKLREDHNECSIDEVRTRVEDMREELGRIRDRVDRMSNGKG